MNKNSKLFYTIFIGIIMFSLVFNVFAEENTGGVDIDGDNVYDMVLSWEIVGANYVQNSTYLWDAENMQYVKNGSESLLTINDAESTITVTNNSNGQIKYNIAYTSTDDFDTTESPIEGYELKKNGKLSFSVEGENSGSDSQSSTYKGIVKLNNYTGAGVSTKIGTYTVTIKKVEVTAEGEEIANLAYTGTAEKGGTIRIGEKTFTVLSNENGVIRAMPNEKLGDTPFSSTNYWDDDYSAGIIKKYDSLDLTHSDNLIRPMLDSYADTLGIDPSSVTLPTYAEVNALTQEERTRGFDYWTRSTYYSATVCYVRSNGSVSTRGINISSGVRPVVVLAE